MLNIFCIHSTDPIDCIHMFHIFMSKIQFQGPQLSQKTVTIRKTVRPQYNIQINQVHQVRESLGMRIGGGIGSNEGDTPIYIANIHPHGCIGKSKQLKVYLIAYTLNYLL